MIDKPLSEIVEKFRQRTERSEVERAGEQVIASLANIYETVAASMETISRLSQQFGLTAILEAMDEDDAERVNGTLSGLGAAWVELSNLPIPPVTLDPVADPEPETEG